MATRPDGTVVENPKALTAALKRLRHLDKAITSSRNVHGRNVHSNRRERLHARVVNVRNDNHHKATTTIAKAWRR